MTASQSPRTIAFFPEGAHGPTNNCVGIGDELHRRGHRVVFIVEESFRGTLQARGFEERTVALGPPAAEDADAGQFWTDFVRETAPAFRRPTIEQLEAFVAPTFQALVDGARYVDEALAEVIDELAPDVIVEDNVVAFPALAASGRPWVRIVSCNPAEIKDVDVPPVFSGYPSTDRSGWDAYWAEYRRTLGPLQARFSEFCVQRGAPPLPGLEFIHESPWLNLTLFPEQFDYRRARPLGPTWRHLGAAVRTTDEPWSPPAQLGGDGALIYLSLGSLGSADVALMQGLIDSLAETPYRIIVSLGPHHDQLRLPANCAGAPFLPQTSVLPHVDLVITHGGNNTVTEAAFFAKPMVVLPLFWDQADNAQRVQEAAIGLRLSTYEHSPAQLRAAIETLLADREVTRRLEAQASALRARPGTRYAAELIEAL